MCDWGTLSSTPQKWGVPVKEEAGRGLASWAPLRLLAFRLSLMWPGRRWDRCHRVHTAPFHSSKTQRKTGLKAREKPYLLTAVWSFH